MSRPAAIRIDDLAHPVLSEAQRAAIAWAESQPVELDEDVVLAAARARTGLDDFGADDFRARLRVWLAAANDDRELNALGRLGLFTHCVRMLANRLRVEDVVARHPEILAIPIDRPIVVAGLMRSGTTHLVSLLAADTRLRSLPYWESLEPVPVPGEGPGRDGRDPRWLRCAEAYDQMRAQMPLLPAMHDMPPEHIHEEIELMELDFGTYLLEWLARPPRWRDHYLGLDLTSSYAYLKKVLQVLTWHRGPRRWVLKSPQHLEQLRPLLTAFPDATIAITHRDPVAVIQSVITMLGYGDRMRRTRVDLTALADYWIDRVERVLRASVRDRDALPAERTLDVRFDDFMADELGTVAAIHRAAGLPASDEARDALARFRAENPRGKHGRIVYDLRADFGLEREAVRARFGFYCERFGVRADA
jgi:hypothetical protein